MRDINTLYVCMYVCMYTLETRTDWSNIAYYCRHGRGRGSLVKIRGLTYADSEFGDPHFSDKDRQREMNVIQRHVSAKHQSMMSADTDMAGARPVVVQLPCHVFRCVTHGIGYHKGRRFSLWKSLPGSLTVINWTMFIVFCRSRMSESDHIFQVFCPYVPILVTVIIQRYHCK